MFDFAQVFAYCLSISLQLMLFTGAHIFNVDMSIL